MSGDKGPRRNLGWDRGDTAGNSVEGLAYYLATQYEGGVPRYSLESIRESLFESRHLNLSISNPEHVRQVNAAVRAAANARIQVAGLNEGGVDNPSMPNLRSYIVQQMRSEYAYTVTAELTSTSEYNPGIIHRTMVIWSDERLSAEQLIERAREQGADIARRARAARGRDYDWGRAGDWADARITLNVWARRG